MYALKAIQEKLMDISVDVNLRKAIFKQLTCSTVPLPPCQSPEPHSTAN